MKLMFPDVIDVINISNETVVGLVIENQSLMSSLVSDIYNQINGFKGKTVLSKDDKPIDISMNMEVLSSYFDFDINKKSIINKIIKRISETLISNYYLETMEFLSGIEKELNKWAFLVQGDIIFSGFTPEMLIKAAGLSLNNDYSNTTEIAEKLIDYLELVREYDRDKLFVFLNMRSFFDDNTMQLFVKSIIGHSFYVLFIDNKENKILDKEIRITIDKDLCKF